MQCWPTRPRGSRVSPSFAEFRRVSPSAVSDSSGMMETPREFPRGRFAQNPTWHGAVVLSAWLKPAETHEQMVSQTNASGCSYKKTSKLFVDRSPLPPRSAQGNQLAHAELSDVLSSKRVHSKSTSARGDHPGQSNPSNTLPGGLSLLVDLSEVTCSGSRPLPSPPKVPDALLSPPHPTNPPDTPMSILRSWQVTRGTSPWLGKVQH